MDEGAIQFFIGFTMVLGVIVCVVALSIMCLIESIRRKEYPVFTKEIEAGAKLLGEKLPSWVEVVDLEKLDLRDTCNCVVGQVFPDRSYLGALEDLIGYGEDDPYRSDDFGFSVYNSKDYPKLTEEWKTYIMERRSQKYDA